MGRAAPHVVGSFPSPGVRMSLRKFRYGARGVSVHGYPSHGYGRLAREAGMEVAEMFPLDRAGHVVHFRRPSRRRATAPGPEPTGGGRSRQGDAVRK